MGEFTSFIIYPIIGQCYSLWLIKIRIIKGISVLEIPVWQQVTREQFENEIVPLNRPALLKSVVGDWSAVRAGAESAQSISDYLKVLDSDKLISAVVGKPEIGGRFFYGDDLEGVNFTRAPVTLSIALEQLLKAIDQPNPHAIAVQAIPIRDALPGFDAQNPQPLLDNSIAPTMWLGNRAMVAPHYDIHDNLAAVVSGRRRFTLYPPEQINNLYPGPVLDTPAGVPVSMVDIRQPDLEQFPNYAKAEAVAQQAVLEPGDAIYIPALWWHGVESLEGLNVLVNYWWGGQSAATPSPNDSMLHSMLSIAKLSPEKREAWRQYFNYYVFQTGDDPQQHLPASLNDLVTELNDQQKKALREFLSKRSL
jgi:mannose-6-phosphate isomerase-like protein (cupin superfamily)